MVTLLDVQAHHAMPAALLFVLCFLDDFRKILQELQSVESEKK